MRGSGLRLLDRFRPLPDAVEVDEVAVELGFIMGPDLLHRQNPFAHQRPAPPGIRAVIAHFLQVPAAANPEQKPSTGQLIERGDLLGGGDRVALDDQAHARPEPELGGHHGGSRQGQERVQGVRVLTR